MKTIFILFGRRNSKESATVQPTKTVVFSLKFHLRFARHAQAPSSFIYCKHCNCCFMRNLECFEPRKATQMYISTLHIIMFGSLNEMNLYPIDVIEETHYNMWKNRSNWASYEFFERSAIISVFQRNNHSTRYFSTFLGLFQHGLIDWFKIWLMSCCGFFEIQNDYIWIFSSCRDISQNMKMQSQF